MTENEYKRKMKELGCDNGAIEEGIKMHNDAANEGINVPYELEVDLLDFEPPIKY